MTRLWLDGLQRVARAPLLCLGVYALTLVTTLPMAFVLHDTITTHLGASLVADAVSQGFDAGWWQEFQYATDGGIVETFGPEVIGFAATLSNLSRAADADLPQGAIASVIVFYVAVWAFLLGGILDRLARQRQVTSAGFFAACGVYFWRFTRLALLVVATYWLLFTIVHPWLFQDVYGALTHNSTVERDAAIVRFSLYFLFGILVAAVTLIFDYAKVRTVVEDRRSMLGAVFASARFVRRRLVSTAYLYLLSALVFVIVVFLYSLVAPSANTSGVAVWLGFAIGQIYVTARLVAKLTLYASQTSFFQSELAHSTYVARPQPHWPISPMVEAIAPTPDKS